MIDLAHLRSLAAVLDAGGFASGAERLGLAQPTVSQHVRKLEARLGVPLVRRGRGGCRPTGRGAEVRRLATSMLRLEQRVLDVGKAGRFVVGASSNIGIYMLQPAVAAYRRETEEGQALDLVIDRNPEIARRLEEGEIDLAVMEWWDGRDGFAADRWREEELVVIIPPGHAWAAADQVPLDWLRKAPLLGGEPGTGTGRLLQAAFGRTMPAVAHRLGSTEGVKRAVMVGLGVSLVLASTVAAEVRAGTLIARPLEGRSLAKPLYMVRPEPSPRAREIAAFAILLAREHLVSTTAENPRSDR